MRWAHANGLTGGILLPGTPPGSGLPELYSSAYDPIWAVCAEPVSSNPNCAGLTQPHTSSEWSCRVVVTGRKSGSRQA